MINYIIQVILFQILFLTIYDFFLSKETFFTKNRWYLLSTSIGAFLLPLIKIPTLQKAVPFEYTILLPEVVLSPQKVIESSSWYQSINYVDVLFWLGCAIFAVLFFIKLEKIIRLILKNKSIEKGSYTLVLLPQETKAFSFFNFIFIGEEIPKRQREKVIQHELVHSKQKHSLDLLLFEILKIVMWFNPMIYIYQKRITLVHEYISDEVITKSIKKEHYINNILSDLFQVESIPFINQFYKHSLIKKRIIMMTKEKSKQIKQVKYLLLVPIMLSMLIYTSCNQNDLEVPVQQKKENQTLYSQKDILKNETTGKKTYLDMYFGFKEPGWKEISYNDLTQNEKEELGDKYEKLKSNPSFIIKFYELENKRRALATIIDIDKMKKESRVLEKEEVLAGADVPFSIIEEVPAYPGCTGTREQRTACLTKKINKFVLQNFNASLAKGLKLSKGKKKVWVVFRIDKEGNIVDVNARAPHPKLKEEAIRVVKMLPQMKPGKQRGKTVGMKYTLPITFNIE